MDERGLWASIEKVVETGEETSTIDLKRHIYYFEIDVEKGEFIKDVVAIANTLVSSEAKGYIVMGVLDSTQRKSIDPDEYIVGVHASSTSQLQQRMNNLLRDYVEPDLTVECFLLVHPLVKKTLVVIIIPCWQSLDPYNPRPCIIKKDIGRVRRGQIFMRARSDTYAALNTDISRLYGIGLQKQIRDLERQNSQQIERYDRDVEGLKRDFDLEIRSLYERIDNLEYNKSELQREAERWRELTRATLLALYRILPEESREKEIRRLLIRFGKENCYSEWFK